MNNKIDALPRVTNKIEEKKIAKELRIALRSGNLPFKFLDEYERRYRRTVYDVGRELGVKFTVNKDNNVWTVNFKR
jgi:hypothetical protein